MSASEVLSKSGGKAFMLCNEAIVRGALEADMKIYAAYPGSPTTEILDTFYEIKDQLDIRVDISTNEKVALETCAGAAMAGMRALTSMKSVGLNVASDSFFSLGYTGVKGGLVLVVADDPHAHSSQNEEDGRFFCPASYIPMLEPSDPNEAKEMVKYAFDLSEKFSVPVLIRTVTRVNHQSGIVDMTPLTRTPFKKLTWPHAPTRFITVADFARQFKINLLERTKKIEKEFENSSFNRVENPGRETGVITSSAGYNYTIEALRILGIKIPVLKLGTTFPLPKNIIKEFIKELKQVIIVEELSPYLETQVNAIAKDINPNIKVIGKGTSHFSHAFEYNANIVTTAFGQVLGIKAPIDYASVLSKAEKLKEGLKIRPPTFCPGCPHRGTIYSVRKALKNIKHVLSTDIGCYSMSPLPPLNYGDSLLSMGASLGVACGMQYAVEDLVIAMIGDSTFYHAGLPGLVNAVHQKANFKLIILDNEVTAMTGQQPHPGTHELSNQTQYNRLVIEDVLRGMGVSDITIIDAYDLKNNIEKIKEVLLKPGLGVIISRRSCALYSDRNKRKRGEAIIPNYVDPKICKNIYACMKDFFCPALSIDENRHASISKDLCDGCMECAKICPIISIKSTEVSK